MPLIAPPAAPTPSDAPEVFDAKIYARLVWDATNVTALNELQADVAANQNTASEAAGVASAQAALAANAAASATGAANFKGEWSTLTGALSRPACVKHSGRFWLLLSDLADVTTATPGASAAWTVMDVGTVPTQLITTNTAAVSGVRYLINAAITLTVPATATKGDYFGFREVAGLATSVVNFGAVKVRGGTPGAMTIDKPCFGIDLFFEDATRGYI